MNLYCLMRPQAVMANDKPLNSEAFSNFPTTTPEDEEDVVKATRHIIEGCAPFLSLCIQLC